MEKGMLETKFKIWDGQQMHSPRTIAELHKDDAYLLGLTQVVYLQYTGRNSQTGQEIYVGDIVTTAEVDESNLHYNWGVVEFGESSYDSGYYMLNGFYIKSPDYDIGDELSGVDDTWNGEDWIDDHGANILFQDNIKIIGNIYENPQFVHKKTKLT